MRIQSYLSLLLFCTIFLEETLSLRNESIGELDRYVRVKRLIDRTVKTHFPNPIRRARHSVNILKNGVSHCGGSILEPDIILTAAHCIRQSIPTSTFTVLSGSSMRNDGIPHDIIKRILHPYYDIALFKIFPPIDIENGINRNIGLFTDQFPPEMFGLAYGIFSGWGCTSIGPNGSSPIYPEELMVTRLPIITRAECVASFKGTVMITVRNICTLDISKRRGTCIGDGGGALVYKHQILGIMSFLRGIEIGENADVFTNMNYPEYIHWVNTRLPLLQD